MKSPINAIAVLASLLLLVISPLSLAAKPIKGQTSTACAAGYADCTADTGCETNISNDPNNCGGCGNVCSAANATSSCMNGTCQLMTCNAGYSDCDSNPMNGCETASNSCQ